LAPLDRRESGTKGLEHFRKALGSPSDASRDDLKFAYRLFVTKFDDRANPVAGIPRPRSPLLQRVDLRRVRHAHRAARSRRGRRSPPRSGVAEDRSAWRAETGDRRHAAKQVIAMRRDG
jgi:hypothetical protein